MSTPAPEVLHAHEHSSEHRAEILQSAICGCFYCYQTYRPDEIGSWIDEDDGVGMTALCPHCGIDSVIGSASGYPITVDFLTMMHEHWFSVQ